MAKCPRSQANLIYPEQENEKHFGVKMSKESWSSRGRRGERDINLLLRKRQGNS